MIIFILLLALALRIVNLGQSLWLDEAIEVLAVKERSYWELLTSYPVGDFHPPLFHLILKAWTSLFGYFEIAARLPSVFFGMGTVYFVFKIAQTLFDKRIAFLAALFMALNPLAVYYSQEARMYSLAAFAMAAAVYFFLKGKWLLFLVSFLAVLYTEYLPWLMGPVFSLFAKKRKTFLLSSILILILLLPWFPIFWRQLATGLSVVSDVPGWGKVVGGFSWGALPLTLVKFTIGRISLDDKLMYGLLVGPVVFVYLLAMARVRNLFLWLWLTFPLAAAFIISLRVPIFSYFRFLFVLPGWTILLAAGAGKSRPIIFLVVFVSFFSFLIFNLYPRFQREDWRGAVGYIKETGAAVVMPSLAQVSPIRYYDPDIIVSDKESVRVNEFSKVFLLRYLQDIYDPDDLARQKIQEAGFKKTGERSFNGGIMLWEYQK